MNGDADAALVLFVAAALCLILVALTVLLGFIESHLPGATEWLDEHVGQPGPWDR